MVSALQGRFLLLIPGGDEQLQSGDLPGRAAKSGPGCREQSVIINLPCHRESRCEQQKEPAKWAALSGGEAGPEGPRARGQGLTLSVTEPTG